MATNIGCSARTLNEWIKKVEVGNRRRTPGCRRMWWSDGRRRSARAASRRKVGVVNKKHIVRMTDGLFCDEALKVAQRWPDIECTMEIVDALNADLYTRPARHDVLLMTNLFGDVLSNLCAALAGGLGIGGGLNAGAGHAMANASHGSAPDIAGQNKANPISMVVSAAMAARI